MIQPRDILALRYIFQHRYSTTVHLSAVAFPGASQNTVQKRLRKLWIHGFVDRSFFLRVLTPGQSLDSSDRLPIYSIAPRGAEVLAEHLGLPLPAIPHTPSENRRGFDALKHHLRVTDFFVALESALRERAPDVAIVIERETRLRRSITDYKKAARDRGPYVVSDGAFTLAFRSPDAVAATFHLELMRADARGGNEFFVGKLEKYVRLYRRGFFARVFGHRRLRAVLIATTSLERSERLRKMADRRLRDGRHLFWFGAFDDRAVLAWNPETVLGPIWRRTDGRVMSILRTETAI